jgi:hypothetical protein
MAAKPKKATGKQAKPAKPKAKTTPKTTTQPAHLTKAQQVAAAKEQKKRSAAGRKAAATRKAHELAGVKPKTRTAPASVYDAPVCAAVAVAAHWEMTTGGRWQPDSVLELAEAGGFIIPDVAEAAGARAQPCDPGEYAAILGVVLPDGRPHAVISIPAGWLSWGTLIDPDGVIEEAWQLTWPRGI